MRKFGYRVPSISKATALIFILVDKSYPKLKRGFKVASLIAFYDGKQIKIIIKLGVNELQGESSQSGPPPVQDGYNRVYTGK